MIGTLSHIEMGWIYNRGEKHAVQSCDLEPWNLGEGGKDVSDYGFQFRAGGQDFRVQVKIKTWNKIEAFEPFIYNV